MLPGLDGFALLKRLRVKSRVPVLMLTARGEDVIGSSGSISVPTIISPSRLTRANSLHGFGQSCDACRRRRAAAWR
jgi:hypothetical protein